MVAKIYNKYHILFLKNLYIPKNVMKKLDYYKINTDFDVIIDNCVKNHGEEWLSKQLVKCFKLLHLENDNMKITCFCLYKNNELKSGEFGIIIGKMYFSYSGYYEESSAGTIQMSKMFLYLKNNGFICCNLFGTGKEDKYRFLTIDINREDYIKLYNELK
jgi:Leu/Phe-tRNA-protein transferase